MRRLIRSFVLVAFTFFSISLCAQTNSRFSPLDKSPMDESYYPVDYPISKIKATPDKPFTDPLIARVVYSRPQKNGRVVFGELVEYGQVWRMGANESRYARVVRYF